MPIYNRKFIHKDTRNPSPKHLQAVGPRVPVEVHIPKQLAEAFAKEEKPIPGCLSGYALIDTGASMMCIDRKIIESLGVQPVNEALVGTVGGTRKQYVYPVNLRFPNTDLPELNVLCLGGDFTGQNETIALIGRDILQNFLLVYNGPEALVTLSY
ncbi:MAG: retropepsin-like domain-containing protein [Candidatus Omnitrophica bacterium]|nr:retropepsin-like domain-containing protein [Candidatus Omnitrophota bacterium]